jgi:hypothetical protein
MGARDTPGVKCAEPSRPIQIVITFPQLLHTTALRLPSRIGILVPKEELMMPKSFSREIRAVLAATGGAAAVGSILGLPSGTQSLLTQGAMLPLIILAVAVVCAPALFIGVGLLGAKSSIPEVCRAVGQGALATGHALLGFVPVALFLTATRAGEHHPAVAVIGLVAVAVVAGALRTLHALAVGSEHKQRLIPYFVCWSGASLTLGALLLFHSFRIGGAL